MYLGVNVIAISRQFTPLVFLIRESLKKLFSLLQIETIEF